VKILAEIIGLSFGRKNKVCETATRAVLEGTGKSVELVSLAGKLIRPCEACNGCADTNKCILKDDFEEIADKLDQAEGIVVGVPTFWGHMNGKGISFWERLCFSGRHNSLFPLASKLAAIVAVDGSGSGEYVIQDLGNYLQDARINIVGTIAVQGEHPCFSCGYGNYCPVGGLVDYFPLGTELTPERVPSLTNQFPEKCSLLPEQRDITLKARELGAVLGKVIDIRISKKNNIKG